MIRTLAEYDIIAERVEGLTGVWVDGNKPTARKICAMGVKCSRWVTMHGIALNIKSDLSYFKNIVPCGINDKAVTSIQNELGKEIDMNDVKQKLKINLSKVFNYENV